VPSAGEGDPALEGERSRGLALAGKLGMPVLARAWQMLLKGLTEVQTAPSPLQAAEMVLIRLAYVADLPTPADLVKTLTAGQEPSGGLPAGASRSAGTAGPGNSTAMPPRFAPSPESAPGGASQLAVRVVPPEATAAMPQPKSFLEVIELFDKHREAILRSHLYAHVHLVRFELGRIELRPTEGAPRDLPNRLGQLLSQWTGARWVVSVSGEEGEPTLQQQVEARARTLRNEASEHPLVQAVLETFPGARIEAVRELDHDQGAVTEPLEGADERSEGDE
jgi:DNA polymerase-3 subunit gamma/tau